MEYLLLATFAELFSTTISYSMLDYNNNHIYKKIGEKGYKVIDNMTISSGQNPSELTPTNATGNTTQRYFYGSWFNVKLGRGLAKNGSYTTFIAALGGNNTATGSSSNITKYRFIVESGFYSSLSVTGGNYTRNNYINGEAVYGNDYDRVLKDNTKLDVYFCASGS
jgi:hypothetical protein